MTRAEFSWLSTSRRGVVTGRESGFVLEGSLSLVRGLGKALKERLERRQIWRWN